MIYLLAKEVKTSIIRCIDWKRIRAFPQSAMTKNTGTDSKNPVWPLNLLPNLAGKIRVGSEWDGQNSVCSAENEPAPGILSLQYVVKELDAKAMALDLLHNGIPRRQKDKMKGLTRPLYRR